MAFEAVVDHRIHRHARHSHKLDDANPEELDSAEPKACVGIAAMPNNSY
jgi:hypothetical protein